MADKSKIEWTDATWNPITGCSVVSPGCTNCYAMRMAGTRLRHHWSREGLTTPSKAGPVWNGKVRFNEEWLRQPLAWTKPRRIFVCAHGDLFHEAAPDAWIDQVFAVMALAPQHTFQVLTKRAERMRAYCNDPSTPGRVYEIACDMAVERRPPVVLIAPGFDSTTAPHGSKVHLGTWPLPNVEKGVSVEDQLRANQRLPLLRATPAVVRFASIEPLLGPIYLRQILRDPFELHNGMRELGWINALTGAYVYDEFDEGEPGAKLDWVIVGGESGPGARPMHPDWARKIRDDCAAAGVAFHFKQWGSWLPADVVEGDLYDQSRFTYMAASGLRDEALRTAEARRGETDETSWWFANVGKRAAGRFLDGRLHDDFTQRP